MKVLWFSNSSAAANSNILKGTGGWMVALDRAIQDKVELHVAYNYPHNQSPFKNAKTTYYPVFSGNIVLESLKKRWIPNYQKKLLNDYLRIIDEIQPDVIHIHGSENTFHQIVGKTDIPIVLSIQGNPTVYVQKYYSGFHGAYLHKRIGKLNLKSIIFGRHSFKDGLKGLEWLSNVEREDFPHILYIIGRTDWDRRITRVLAPNSRYFVVNEALRDAFYDNEWKMDAPKEKLVIHTTNGNNYYKGFETLCHALNLLNNIGLDVEWRVAGVSENSEINKITKKFLGKNYPKKGLKLMGSLDEKGLVDSLMTSHLYVMPSHIENSPNNLCEAMLLGLPCITTLAGGSDSILINKKEGLVIQDGDPWSMAGAIIELKNDWNQALQYGQEARKHALIRHNKETIVSSLIRTYKEIIENEKRI